jgi:hypothetical protein
MSDVEASEGHLNGTNKEVVGTTNSTVHFLSRTFLIVVWWRGQ